MLKKVKQKFFKIIKKYLTTLLPGAIIIKNKTADTTIMVKKISSFPPNGMKEMIKVAIAAEIEAREMYFFQIKLISFPRSYLKF